jgi:hypothetical protein
MRNSVSLSERELEAIEREKDPEIVPHLVSTIRQQQHELEALRLSMEVARRDREELRVALLSARAELDRLGTDSTVPGASASEER